MNNKKVALVTGGSNGIGEAIAKKFGQNGYAVALTYCKSKDKAQEVAKDISMAKAFYYDASDLQSASCIIDAVVKHFGRIDVLVNNAGIYEPKDFLQITPKDWQRTLDVNLIAPFELSKHAAKHIKKGVIINIGSTSAKLNNPSSPHYDASKAGLNTLTNNIAMNYQPNIRAVTVSPGYVLTSMTTEDEIKNANCLRGKLASVTDIANVVFFVASDEAVHINATEIVVNGGGLN